MTVRARSLPLRVRSLAVDACDTCGTPKKVVTSDMGPVTADRAEPTRACDSLLTTASSAAFKPASKHARHGVQEWKSQLISFTITILDAIQYGCLASGGLVSLHVIWGS